MAKKRHSGWRAAALVLTLVCLCAVGVLGWNWLDGLVAMQITVDGHRHAERDDLLAVARVDTGVRLLNVEPEIIADRVARHPWIRRADVRRLPPGTVSIRVEERRPVALAIDEGGRPSAYVDAEGFTMPVVDGAVFDVPLIHGLIMPANRTQRIDERSVLDLLATLGELDARSDALVSTFEVGPSGDLTMHTIPAGGRQAVPVLLGKRDFAEKFVRLAAFWQRAVLSRPDVAFEMIDLRFDSQIVTRES